MFEVIQPVTFSDMLNAVSYFWIFSHFFNNLTECIRVNVRLLFTPIIIGITPYILISLLARGRITISSIQPSIFFSFLNNVLHIKGHSVTAFLTLNNGST